MRTTTARAYPNIALVKYWGKRDEARILPAAGSLSMTLDAFETTTTVVPAPGRATDILELDGEVADEEATRRITAFLDHVRALAGSEQRVIVRSTNSVPTGAGLASSASGFAALATAAAAAFDLDLDDRALSRLARLGSGSACRSTVPGVAVWHAGDDETSFAEPVEAPDMRMVVVTVDPGRKAISSRTAMRLTAATSPFYDAWVTSTEQSLADMVEACEDKDFTRIGEITESHGLRMHALIQSTMPPIRFLRPQSIAIYDAVEKLRETGIEAYSTADAGPNVVVLVRPGDAEAVATALNGYGQIRIVGPGPGAQLLPEGSEVPAATEERP
ncbi:MAG: diphosphomevalonate decarboxylase [Brevibacterium sp.]|uniref:diphosphomevalonate decarboxylase n=1 Tax=Brevibacterium aurantiacum TaxID=273384 RepID=A0A2A3Z9Z2_BREAU|nr:diphosphomevalonate decarboxylase [Brevibacterium aurantiacum]PCC48317.1 diphosphomevalonate decarboxylase [Brevibacterium aurantiacum]